MTKSSLDTKLNMGLDQFLDRNSIHKLKQVLVTIIRVHTHKPEGVDDGKHKENNSLPSTNKKGKDIVLLDARCVLLEISRFLQQYKQRNDVSQTLGNACIIYVFSFLLYACSHIRLYMYTTNVEVHTFQLVSIKYEGPPPIPAKGYLQPAKRRPEITHSDTRQTMSMATFVNLQATESYPNVLAVSPPTSSFFTVDVTGGWLRDRVNNLPLFYQRVPRNEMLSTRLLRKLKRLTNTTTTEPTPQLLAVTTSTGLCKFETMFVQKRHKK
jgi:hypothetical protein